MVFIYFNPKKSGIIQGMIIQRTFTNANNPSKTPKYVIDKQAQNIAIQKQKSHVFVIRAVAILVFIFMILLLFYTNNNPPNQATAPQWH